MGGLSVINSLDPVTRVGLIHSQTELSVGRAKEAATANAESMASARAAAASLDRAAKTAAGIERRFIESEARIGDLEAQRQRLEATLVAFGEAIDRGIAKVGDAFQAIEQTVVALTAKATAVRELERDIESLFGKVRQTEQMAENGLVTLSELMKRQLLLGRAIDEIRAGLPQRPQEGATEHERAQRFLRG